jgi:hypothetical protein
MDRTGSIGIRSGEVQVAPSSEVLSTMSLALQPGSNRQSLQVTYTRPVSSVRADGSAPPLRMFPAEVWRSASAMGAALLKGGADLGG